MRRMIHFGAVAAVLLLAAAPAHAQSGFALKGGAVFNSSQAEPMPSAPSLAEAAGFSVGAEVVLPGGLGVGLSGYTAGSPRDFDLSEGSLVFLGEANYFLRLPFLPVSPYAGLHAGLGRYDLDDVQERVRPTVDFGDVGYQLGLRFQPTPVLGIDAQYRRVSGSLQGTQDAGFETGQVLLGVTLF